jgi:hypothetical protein
VDVNCDSTDVDESDRDGDGEPACDDCNDDDPTDASCKPGDEPNNGGGGNESSGGCSCATTPPGTAERSPCSAALWRSVRRRR